MKQKLTCDLSTIPLDGDVVDAGFDRHILDLVLTVEIRNYVTLCKAVWSCWAMQMMK